jgi:FkbM family methyltransferase
MGLNLIRFATDPQYRAVKRWKWAKGDETLRFSVAIPPGGAVLDIGAYTGEYAEALAARGVGRIEAFEPVPDYAAACRARAARHPAIRVHEYGLADRDFRTRMTLDGLASSSYRSHGAMIEAEFRDIAGILAALDLPEIALAKINIEGGEYAILPRLIETGLITRFAALLIQFHRIDSGSEAAYATIAARLSATHAPAWRYPFVWELWQRR